MRTEAEQRAAVVREALTWERTPFHWEGTVKGVGVDCGRFIACVLNNAGVQNIDLKKLPHLPPQWFMHSGADSYLNVMKVYATEYELQPGQVPQPGDLVVAKYGLDWAHSALVVEWPKVIGASPASCVSVWLDIRKSPQYAGRELKFLNPWGQHD